MKKEDRFERLPGLNRTSFKIKLDQDWFQKNEIISNGEFEMIVTKVYKYTWYKKLLNKLGFNIKWFEGVKVKNI